MKTLYLVRHGKSEVNGKNIYQRKDILLSEEGREQARILQKRFENIPIDVVYSSSLIRAKETAKIINEELKLPIYETALADERVNAESLLGLSLDGEESMEFRRQLVLHKEDPYWRWKDEEPVGKVRDRIIQFLDEMKKESHDNVLVVTHAWYLKVLLGVVLFGLDAFPFNDDDYFNAKMTNTGISIFQLEDGKDNWKLVTWNDYAHLGNI